jgi:hypothetical protein
LEKKETMIGCTSNLPDCEISLEGLGLSENQLKVTELLDAMTSDERGEVFYFYCQFCGDKQYRSMKQKNGCTCMRDD